MSTAAPAANWIAQAEVKSLPRLPIPPLQDTLKYRHFRPYFHTKRFLLYHILTLYLF